MKNGLMLIAYLLFLPFILIWAVFKSKRSIIRKIGYFFLVIIIFGLIWWKGAEQIIRTGSYNLYETGVSDKLVKVKISGTSMLPGIKDGDEVSLLSPKKYGLERGDIVSFNNKETGSSFYIKRIVGLPGEEVSIRNGHVFINGKVLEEKYTLNNLPTFGNSFITDCESYKVPENHLVVLGDNRTVSSDSRVLGFINKDDIEGVIKTKTEEKFLDQADQNLIIKKEIKAEEFLKKLNEQRTGKNLSLLTTHDTLNNLAKKRAEQIKDNLDTYKKEQDMVDKFLDESGYRINQAHEFVTFGYLDEQAIIDQILDSQTQTDSFMSSNFSEVGIGIVEKTNKECTFPVISVILSWPAVPTYDKSVSDSWAREVSINNESLRNLQTWVGIPDVDQIKLKQMIAMVAQMQQTATRINSKIMNKEWLNTKDYQDITQYDEMVKQLATLDAELFKNQTNVQGISKKTNDNRRI